MPRDEMLAYIRAETAAGRTYGAIAKALGVTRNVVAGLCARNAIRGPNAAFHKGGRTAASPRELPQIVAHGEVPMLIKPVAPVASTPAPTRDPLPPEPAPRVVIVPEGRETFAERMAALEAAVTYTGCAWLHGAPAEGRRCGAPKSGRSLGEGRPSPYCEHHHLRAYTRAPKADLAEIERKRTAFVGKDTPVSHFNWGW